MQEFSGNGGSITGFFGHFVKNLRLKKPKQFFEKTCSNYSKTQLFPGKLTIFSQVFVLTEVLILKSGKTWEFWENLSFF